MDSKEKLIWAAGFLDGEGYISVTHSKNPNRTYRFNHREEITAAQVHREPLDVLVELFGGRVLSTKDNYGRHFYWRLYCGKAVEAIRQLLPYLIVKKLQAELVIVFAETAKPQGRRFKGQYRDLPEDVYELREALYGALKDLNKRRVRHAERLNEKAPTELNGSEGDAIVRPHGNKNRENVVEIATSKRIS